MDNGRPNFLDKWARSPRQDRRVLVDGKFVELTDPIIPSAESGSQEPEFTPQTQINPTPVTQEGQLDWTLTGVGPTAENSESVSNIRPCRQCGKTVDFSDPYCEHETMEESAWLDIRSRVVAAATDQVIEDLVHKAAKELGVTSESEKLQENLEPIDAVAEHLKGTQTVAEVLSAIGEKPVVETVLDGKTGRIEETPERISLTAAVDPDKIDIEIAGGDGAETDKNQTTEPGQRNV